MKNASSPSNELIRRAKRSLTRLARFTNRLQRTRLSCGSLTVQQCNTLEALANGPLPMSKLADEVGLHQSTLTRVVEKLEAKKLLFRQRPDNNQRVVNVRLTDDGKSQFAQIDAASNHMIAHILALADPVERPGAVRGLEVLCDLLDPANGRAQQLITGGCRCKDLQVPPAGPLPETER